MKTIIFDQTSLAWNKDDEFNRYFIRQQVFYILEKLRWRKYLYLNEIYQAFKIAWNPDWENTCYRNVDEFKIDLEPSAKDRAYVIKIY